MVFSLLILASLFSGPPVIHVAHAQTYQGQFPIAEYATTTEALIARYASQFDVSATILAQVINCESRGLETAVGDQGRSFGIAQIFLPAHPEISKKQALNKEFSIQWMAQQFSLGREWMWTCYRQIKSPQP